MLSNAPAVVVTGMGVLTPLGENTADYFSHLCDGVSGIGPVSQLDLSAYATKVAGEVAYTDTELSHGLDLHRPRDRGAAMLARATNEALSSAGPNALPEDRERVSLVTGTTLGGMRLGEQFYRSKASGAKSRNPPSLPVSASMYAANDEVMSALGLRGQSVVISTACSASSHAIGCGMNLLRSGVADLVLVGGYEPLSEITFAGFSILRAMARDAIRPFDKNRTGLVLGEGAGMLVLERADRAERRKARIFAEVVSYSGSSDAYHMTGPSPQAEGARSVIANALQSAGLTPETLDYVNAHGTATPANDSMETMALKRALGEHAYRVPVSSSKSMIGHLLGAAGAVEAIATIMAVCHNKIPPTINYDTADPLCDLDYVPWKSRAIKVDLAISTSFGFGGNNAALLFRKYRAETL